MKEADFEVKERARAVSKKQKPLLGVMIVIAHPDAGVHLEFGCLEF